MDGQISMYTDVLQEEIEELIDVEFERMQDTTYENYIQRIRSLHEGYGYVAEYFKNISVMYKKLQKTLDALLEALSSNSGEAANDVAQILMYSIEMEKDAIRLAAISKRISTEVDFNDDLPPEAYGTEPEFEESEVDT